MLRLARRPLGLKGLGKFWSRELRFRVWGLGNSARKSEMTEVVWGPASLFCNHDRILLPILGP